MPTTIPITIPTTFRIKLFSSLVCVMALCFTALALANSSTKTLENKDANVSLSIHYLATKNQNEKRAQQQIKASGVNNTLVELSNQLFEFNDELKVIYGGNDGPLYDPQAHSVHIPYEFFIQSQHYFSKNNYEKRFGKRALIGAEDTLLHTLLHEAAHAYIVDQNIPILGKEEDAADNFATVIMLEYLENGDDMAISAADMFAFESEDRPEFSNLDEYYDFGEYIDDHSFDLQRYFSTLCLVYGWQPERHPELLEQVEAEYRQEREQYCAQNYPVLSASWHQYFTQGEDSFR